MNIGLLTRNLSVVLGVFLSFGAPPASSQCNTRCTALC